MVMPENIYIPFSQIRVGRFLALLIAMLLYFILRPFLEGFVRIQILMSIFFSIILLSGIYAISQKKHILIIALVLAVPLLLIQWGKQILDISSFMLVSDIFGILFFGYSSVIILAYLFREKEITGDVIIGSICAYLMIGFMWSSIFSMLEIVCPGSFNLPEISGLEGSGFTYYSFVTLTTLGYGDITPLTAPARSFALLEAVTGQLYIAVLVARLVGIHISQSMQK